MARSTRVAIAVFVGFAHDEVAFPVPGYRAVGDLGGPVADHDHRIDETVRALIWAAVRSASRAARSKCLGHFAFESTAGLEVQRLVDRFVAHPHTLVVGEIFDEAMGDLFGRQSPRQPILHRLAQILVGDQFGLFRASAGRRCSGVGAIGQVKPVDTAVTDFSRHRRDVLADPGGDHRQRLLGLQPIGNGESIRQAQVPAADLRHTSRDTVGPIDIHRLCVSRAVRVIDDRAIDKHPRVADFADSIAPITAGAFMHADLTGSARR